MRGALDRRVFATVSHKVRHYCSGRGRGRAAPLSSSLPSPPKPPPTGLGHGTAVPAPKSSSGASGRGRGIGVVVTRPIGETSVPSVSASPSPPVVKGRGRGESPVLAAARNVDVTASATASTAAKPAVVSELTTAASSGNTKPPAKSKKDGTAKKTTASTGVVSTPDGEADHKVNVVSAASGPPAPASVPAPVEHIQHVQQHVSQASPAQAQYATGAPGGAPQPASVPPQADEGSEVFAALINCCLARGLVHEIDYVYGAMRAAHVPMAMHTCRTLIDAYMRLGNLQKMDLMYMEMKQNQMGHRQPEASSLEKMQASQTLAAMINTWYSRGFFQEVDLAYRGLKVCHLPVPMQVYGAVMDSYSRLGNQGAMDMVYGEMRAAMATSQQASAPPPYHAAAPGYGHYPGAPQQYVGQIAYYPPPPQMHHAPVYQAGYAPPQFQPMQAWAQPPSPYYAHPHMQPAQMPNMVTQGYPGYQPAQQYPPYAPYPRPQVQPVSVPQPTAHQTPPTIPANMIGQPQARQPDVSHAPRPKLELQPKALELLQQSEYSKLLKNAQDRAAVHRVTASTEAVHAQTQVQQAHPHSVPQYTVQPPYPQPQYALPPQYPPAAPAISVSPTVRPMGQAPPSSGYPGQVIQPTVPSRPAVVSKPIQQVTPSSKALGVAIPAADKPPTPVTGTARTGVQKVVAQVPSAAKADTKTVATKVQDAKLSIAKAETAERKPLPAKPTTQPGSPDAKPPTSVEAKQTKPAQMVKPLEAETKPSIDLTTELPSAKVVRMETGPKLKLGLKEKKQVAERTEERPSTALADKGIKPEEVPPPPTLKLDPKEDRQEKTETVAQPEEPPMKVSSLKLTIAGRGKGGSVVEEKAASLPKSPSLRLDLKKQPELTKQVEEVAEETEPAESESSETEVVPALPSLRRKTARGRGKGLTVDPVASILGVHTPVDALLHQDGLDSEPDQEMPTLPFEPRRGIGRGKPLPVVDPSAVAAEAKRLKVLREEQAARAIAILESGLGKSQMSVYLERRKKRLSDQQFSLGLGDASRRRTEGRTGGTRKAKDSKQKAIQGEIDVDGAIEYIAPQEYMSKGDALTDVEEAIKGTLHRHFMLDLDPEAAMEEFGTNPDIDDKPLPTLEQTLEKAKEKLMAEDAIDEKDWEEAVEDVKKRAPQLESLVQRYTGPKKQNAKENNKELHEIVSKLPPFAPPELAAFTKRAMTTLQNNPDWSQNQKTRLLHRLVWDTQRVMEATK